MDEINYSMKDIIKIMSQNLDSLNKGLASATAETKNGLAKSLLQFFLLLPGFEQVVKQYLGLDVTKEQLSNDIGNNDTEKYRSAIEEYVSNTDEYSEDFEELDTNELFILEALSAAVSQNIAALFEDIINTLDFCEQFSEESESKYWRKLMDEELDYQTKLTDDILNQKDIDVLAYKKRYEGVDFSILE